MLRTKITLSYLLVLTCVATGADAAAPTCRDGWEAFEIEGHNACSWAQWLLSAHCPSHPDSQSVQIEPTSTWYKAWNFSGVAPCACSMTMYNLLSVCAGCQKWDVSDATNQSWQTLLDYQGQGQICNRYQQDNQTIWLQPDHADEEWVKAPAWSKDNSGVNFNFTRTLALASLNEATPSTPSTPDTPMSTLTPTPMAASSKSGPNVGAIAGGVVGGVVLLGAIVGLVLFLRRRKRRARDVAPSDEFLKPEYYASPPLLPAQDRGDPSYRDDIEEEPIPPMPPMPPHRLSWVGGMVGTRRRDDGSGDELPPFTQGTYIGPSPHEKEHPERRRTDETVATTTSNSHLLSSASQPGTSERD